MADQVDNERWKDWTHSSAGTEWKDAYYSFTKDQNKNPQPQEVDTSKSWKDIEWDKQREESARLVLQQELDQLTDEERNKYEINAASFWDDFYEKHNNNFFKQRNYLPNEFPEVVMKQDDVKDKPRKIIVELGCGNGSSFYPLIQLYKDLSPNPFVYGIDFSSAAIEHIKVWKIII